MNFALTCFSAVLFPGVGSDSATSLVVFSSLCSISRSLFQYGLYSFLARFGMASFADDFIDIPIIDVNIFGQYTCAVVVQ